MPPPPASRSNSSRNLLAHEASNKSIKAAPTNTPSPAKKKQKKHKSPPPRASFFDRLLGWLLPLIVIYIAWVCPSDTTLKNPACRSLSLYSDHVLRPYILPSIRQALGHPAIQPYVEKAVQFEQTVEPYVVTVAAKTTPYVIKTKQAVWDRTALPFYRRYVLPQFYIRIYPHLLNLYAKVDPYFSPVHQRITAFITETSYFLHRLDTATRPHLHRAYVTVKPHAIRFYEVSRPIIARAYESGKAYAITGYDIAKPYVRLAYFRTTRRARHYTRKLKLLRKQYVDKHVLEIWEKVKELSGSRDPTSTPQPVKETVAQSAITTASQSTPDTTVSTSSVIEPKVDATGAVDASDAATLLSASSVMAQSASSVPSQLVEISTSSESSPDAAITPESISTSPSSVIKESASPSSEETNDQQNPFSTSAVSSSSSGAIEDSEKSSAASVIMESVMPSSVPVEQVSSSIFASAASTAGTPQSDEEDLDDLLRDLGLTEPEEDLSEEILGENLVEKKPLSPAEKEEQKRKRQAEKRADITGRHIKWAEKLDELIKVRKKSVRKMLVRVRKASVNALSDKSDEADDSTSPEDLEKVRYIEGERVSLLLDNLAADGEKLLKGLDTYLKKEEKIVKSSPSDIKDRVKKWETFLEKVEDKFSDLSTALRGKVHRWFIQVKDIEIRDVRVDFLVE